MEGERQWAFTAPAYSVPSVQHAHKLAVRETYLPKRRRKRRRPGSKRCSGKREKFEAEPPAPPPLPAWPPNPAQLAPLRCSWPHPAVVSLIVQQCMPAAGPAALAGFEQPAAAGPDGRRASLNSQHASWSHMLPSLSLSHPPLAAELRQELLHVASDVTGGVAQQPAALELPQPNVLVGYEDDWLEVPPQVLSLWSATPLAPVAGPKPLLHYLVCPPQQLSQAQQFVKDVGCVYETCNLGSHQPAAHDSALTIPLSGRADGAEGNSRAVEEVAGSGSAPTAVGYLTGLRQACEQLQRQLLLDPPDELTQQGGSVHDASPPGVVVYLVCPLEQQRQQVAALLEAASCLAPCTRLGALAGHPLLPLARSLDLGQGCGPGLQALAPLEPQQPDRCAVATPASGARGAPAASTKAEAEQEGGEAADGVEAAGVGPERYQGAEQEAHQQQHGGSWQLPVQVVARPDGGRLNLVLQLVKPEALADLSGAAARCTALALYSKMQRSGQPPDHEQLRGSAGERDEPLTVCSQPLVLLADAVAQPGSPVARIPQQEQKEQPCVCKPEAAEVVAEEHPARCRGGLAPRTLHCFYTLPPPGACQLPLVFADSCGELLHAEVLHLAAARIGSRDSAANGKDAAAQGIPASPVEHACCQVLQRSLQLLGMLQAASEPPNLLCRLTIGSGCMGREERRVWRRLLGGEQGVQLELPPGVEAAVVEMEALPPARYAGPEPPAGYRLLLQPCMDAHEGRQQQATIAWLPPGANASSMLPGEHDTVRMLRLGLAATGPPADTAASPQHGGGTSLRLLAEELHGLAWLHAAIQGAGLRTATGAAPPAAQDAHLPLHAAACLRLRSLIAAATSCAG